MISLVDEIIYGWRLVAFPFAKKTFVSGLRPKRLCSLHDFGCWLVGISMKGKFLFFFFFFYAISDQKE
jgi:hypothetical protein